MLHPSLRGARACIFDAGGTLVHPDWPRLASFAEGAVGRVLAPEEMRRAMGGVLKAVGVEMQKNPLTPADERSRHWVFRRMYLALGVEQTACEQVIAQLDAAHFERHLWCGIDPDTPRVLEALKREGLRIAIISNTEDGRLRDSLEAAEIADLFDLLVDSHLAGCRKPEAIFRLALDELDIEAGEAAFVGDSYAHDALAARAAGLRAILLDPLGLHPESICPRIRSLGDLIRGGV